MKFLHKGIGLLVAILITILIFVFKENFIQLQGFGLVGLFIISIIGNATIILPAPVILSAFVASAILIHSLSRLWLH
jgi:hypothetical protein